MYFCKKIENDTDNCVVCANYNSANQIVLSGYKEALDIIKHDLPENTCKMLEVTHAFHSPLMKEITGEFNAFVKQIEFKQPTIPVVSSVTAYPYVASWSIPEMLTTQLTSNVQWKSVIDYLEKRGCVYFVQVTDSPLFKTMDNSLSKNHVWITPEKLNSKDRFDFNSLYAKSADNSFTQVMIVGDILFTMIAFPWNLQATEEEIMWAKKEYDRIQKNYIKCCDDNIEVSKKELSEYISVLNKVLDLKELQDEDKNTIISGILRKYGLEGEYNEK